MCLVNPEAFFAGLKAISELSVRRQVHDRICSDSRCAELEAMVQQGRVLDEIKPRQLGPIPVAVPVAEVVCDDCSIAPVQADQPELDLLSDPQVPVDRVSLPRNPDMEAQSMKSVVIMDDTMVVAEHPTVQERDNEPLSIEVEQATSSDISKVEEDGYVDAITQFVDVTGSVGGSFQISYFKKAN